jgi:hypothetical protein
LDFAHALESAGLVVLMGDSCIDTRCPRPHPPLATIVAADPIRIAAGIITGGESVPRTTAECEAERCEDRA